MKVNYLKYNTKRIKLLTNFKKRKKIKKYAFFDNLLRLYQIRFRFRLGSHHSSFLFLCFFLFRISSCVSSVVLYIVIKMCSVRSLILCTAASTD